MSVTTFSQIQINLSRHQKYELDIHKLLRINDKTVTKGARRGISCLKNYSEGGMTKNILQVPGAKYSLKIKAS